MSKHPPKSSIMQGFRQQEQNAHVSKQYNKIAKSIDKKDKKDKNIVVSIRAEIRKSKVQNKTTKQSRYVTVSRSVSTESIQIKKVKNNKQIKQAKEEEKNKISKSKNKNKSKETSKPKNGSYNNNEQRRSSISNEKQLFHCQTKQKQKKQIQSIRSSIKKQKQFVPKSSNLDFRQFPSQVKRSLKKLKPKVKTIETRQQQLLQMSVFDQLYNHSSTDPSKKLKKNKNKQKKNNNGKRVKNNKSKLNTYNKSQFIEYQAEQSGDEAQQSDQQATNQDGNLKQLINDKVKLNIKDEAKCKQKYVQMMLKEDQKFYEMILKGDLFKRKPVPQLNNKRQTNQKLLKSYSKQVDDLIDDDSYSQSQKKQTKPKKQIKQKKKETTRSKDKYL